MKKIFLFPAFLLFVTLLSCGHETDKHSHESGSGESVHEEEEVLSLTNEQIKQIGITFGYIEQKELTNAIKANGILTVPPQNKAFVSPLYSGVIRRLLVQPGSSVRAGDLIATLQNQDLIQLQSTLTEVRMKTSLAEKEWKRQEELYEGNAGPRKQLELASYTYESLKSQLKSLEQQWKTIGAGAGSSTMIQIKAPISGTVSKVMSQLGSEVNSATPIAEIVNNSQLHLDLYVYEKNLPQLKVGQVIHFSITNHPGKEYDAEIFSIGAAFEPGSKTIPVHARVKGEKTGLIDGMSITALVSLNQSTVTALPDEAIVNDQGKDYIFRMVDKQPGKSAGGSPDSSVEFERVLVAKGTSDIGYTEVTLLQSIPSQSKIVVKGAFFLMAKMNNTGDSHAH